MIYPSHNIIAETAYKLYLNRLLRKNFSRFLILNEFPDISADKGLMITPNHFSWWDGFFINYVLSKYLKRKPYLMMLEEQLSKYPFFRRVGAFSINPGSIAEIKESLSFAKKIVSSPGNYLIFYPQGEIQPNDASGITLKKGLLHITENSAAEVLIVSFKVCYGNKKLPDVICRFGEKYSSDFVSNNYEEYERKFKENINIPESEDILKNSVNILL